MALGKGQHRNKEYLSMNPLGKVPCLKVKTLDLRPGSQKLMQSVLRPCTLFKWITLGTLCHHDVTLQEADGYVLPESSAILKYLAQKHHVADHWYPGGFSGTGSHHPSTCSNPE